jgi:hypothetical protein
MAEVEYASKGIAGAGLGTGIAGLTLGVLNGGLNGILGGGCGNYMGRNACCSENNMVTRYELGQESRISKLESEIALRDANIYNDQKILELYKYIDGKLEGVNGALATQAVYNATQTATMNCMQGQIGQLFNLTKLVVPNASVCPGYSN